MLFVSHCRTAQLGFGAPPEDKVSSLVVGVISAGLGLPVILIMFGGLFVIIKKKTSKEGYTDLDTDRSNIQWGAAQHSKGPIVCENTQGESFGARNIVVWNLDFPTSLFSTPIWDSVLL